MQTQIVIYPTGSEDKAPLEGKFLQLRFATRYYLLFAAVGEHRYHNQILARFLSEQGVPHRWEGAASLIVDHSELAVIGGGRFRLDPSAMTLRVWDDSSVYGCFDPSRLVAQLAAAGFPWARLALNVG